MSADLDTYLLNNHRQYICTLLDSITVKEVMELNIYPDSPNIVNVSKRERERESQTTTQTVTPSFNPFTLTLDSECNTMIVVGSRGGEGLG